MNNPFNGSNITVTKIVQQKKLSLIEIIDREDCPMDDHNEYYTLMTNGTLIRHSIPEEPMHNFPPHKR